MRIAWILSMLTAAIAFLLSESRIAAPLRSGATRLLPSFGRLLACGYCTGHWVAFGLVAAYRPDVLEAPGVIELLLATLLVAWLAGLQWVTFVWLLKVAGK
jgi:hypothetical protein